MKRTGPPKSRSPRRPLQSRGQAWAQGLARVFIRLKVAPNAISVAGLVIAALGGYSLVHSGASHGPSLLLAAACIQLRLFCNLMDGMVAIEGRLKSRNGELYNEVPDRFADLVLLVSAGYALPFAWGPALGWACGVAAVLTAYLRLFGGSLGLPQDFRGPQAKPQRMALLTAACLLATLAPLEMRSNALAVGLILILAGTSLTFLRRLWAIDRAL